MNNYIRSNDISYDDLVHYGVKGMKWGVRRYHKKDGTLTPAGKKMIEEARSNKPKMTNSQKTMIIKKLKNDKTATKLEKEYEVDIDSAKASIAEMRKYRAKNTPTTNILKNPKPMVDFTEEYSKKKLRQQELEDVGDWQESVEGRLRDAVYYGQISEKQARQLYDKEIETANKLWAEIDKKYL